MWSRYSSGEVWHILANYAAIRSLSMPQASRAREESYVVRATSVRGDSFGATTYAATVRDPARAVRNKEDLLAATCDLETALSVLSDEDWELVVRYFLMDETIEELAVRFGYARGGSVYNRLQAICTRLARAMNGEQVDQRGMHNKKEERPAEHVNGIHAGWYRRD